MTDLAECKWQTVDVRKDNCPESAVVFAFFPQDGVSYQEVQCTICAGPYVVEPFLN